MADLRLLIDPSALDPSPWNPKSPIGGRHRVGLKASLDHFGVRDDLKVWPNPEAPGRYFVLDGNQRLDLLKDRAEPIECRVLADLDDNNARLFTAAYNRNQAAYDEVKLEALAASLTAHSGELKSRLLRINKVAPAPSGRPSDTSAEVTRQPDGPTVPLLVLLTREGAEAIREGILKIRSRLAREAALREAVAALADHELDSAAVELALRILHAQRASAEET